VFVTTAFACDFIATAACLATEDGAAEEAESWVGDFFAGRRTWSLACFFRQRVESFRQSNQFEDTGV